MSSKKIVARLAAAGCVFPDGQPTQAHYRQRGDSPNTWLVRRDKLGSNEYLVETVRWLLGAGTEYPSSGHEIILDLPVTSLARTPCLVGYTPYVDPWDLHLTDLDGFAGMEQALLCPHIQLVHWIEKRRPLGPIGHNCIVPSRGRRRGVIVETRYFGVEGVDPQIGVRVADQSHNVDWFRLSEVEVDKMVGER